MEERDGDGVVSLAESTGGLMGKGGVWRQPGEPSRDGSSVLDPF